MRISFFISLFFFFIGSTLAVNASVFDFIVDAGGNGDYTTIQEAIDAVTDNNENRTLIFVCSGTYNEKIEVPDEKINVSLIGENVNNVILTWDDYAGTATGLSSADTYTIIVNGKDFYMENVTVQNTAGQVGQALAIRTVGDRGVYKNCHFLGFQDTYYAHKARQYNYQCYVEGGTDFIYGDATAVFDSCTINCVNGGSYITAPADTKLVTEFSSGTTFYHGLMIYKSIVTCDDDVSDNSYYLGRPWQPDASSVYILCKLGDHIKPAGWNENDGNESSGYFGEYKSVDFDGNAVDTTQRVSWSHQISDKWYEKYYDLDFFFKKNGVVWDAKNMIKTLASPTNVKIESGELSWDTVANAIGYVVYNADTLYAFATTNALSAGDLNIDNVVVKSVRDNGAMSDEENSNLLSGKKIISQTKLPNVWVSDKTVYSTIQIQVLLYNLKGVVIKKFEGDKQYSLEGFTPGFYIIKATNEEGLSVVQKVVL